jgi:hypothetical protein
MCGLVFGSPSVPSFFCSRTTRIYALMTWKIISNYSYQRAEQFRPVFNRLPNEEPSVKMFIHVVGNPYGFLNCLVEVPMSNAEQQDRRTSHSVRRRWKGGGGRGSQISPGENLGQSWAMFSWPGKAKQFPPRSKNRCFIST